MVPGKQLEAVVVSQQNIIALSVVSCVGQKNASSVTEEVDSGRLGLVLV